MHVFFFFFWSFVSSSFFHTRHDGRFIRPLDEHGDYIRCHFSRTLNEGSKVYTRRKKKKENKEVDRLHPGRSIAFVSLSQWTIKSKYNKLINRPGPGIQVTIHTALPKRRTHIKNIFQLHNIFFSWSNFVPVADFSRCNEKWICSDFSFLVQYSG